MASNLAHLRHQGPMLATLGRTAFEALRQKIGRPAPPTPVPGPPHERTLPPRDPAMVGAYVRAMGGDPAAWAGRVPPHLFAQWAFPLVAKALIGVPYPLLGLLNGGCRLRVNGPLPLGEPLQTRAHLADIDDDGRRAVLHVAIATGPPSQPDALDIDFYAIVRLRGGGTKKQAAQSTTSSDAKRRREHLAKTRVPDKVRELARWRLTPKDARDFALLTGDFNPIHWLPPAAKAAGFNSVILHGFASMGRAAETLTAEHYGGHLDALRTVDVRFTRPLVLPKQVGLYVDDEDGVFVGDRPGGAAYLRGRYEGPP